MYTKLLTKQPEQLQVLQIQASIDRNNLGAEIWKGHRTSAHVVWKVRTLEDRDLEGTYNQCTCGRCVHLRTEIWKGHRAGTQVGAVYT